MFGYTYTNTENNNTQMPHLGEKSLVNLLKYQKKLQNKTKPVIIKCS